MGKIKNECQETGLYIINSLFSNSPVLPIFIGVVQVQILIVKSENNLQ